MTKENDPGIMTSDWGFYITRETHKKGTNDLLQYANEDVGNSEASKMSK